MSKLEAVKYLLLLGLAISGILSVLSKNKQKTTKSEELSTSVELELTTRDKEVLVAIKVWNSEFNLEIRRVTIALGRREEYLELLQGLQVDKFNPFTSRAIHEGTLALEIGEVADFSATLPLLDDMPEDKFCRIGGSWDDRFNAVRVIIEVSPPFQSCCKIAGIAMPDQQRLYGPPGFGEFNPFS